MTRNLILHALLTFFSMALVSQVLQISVPAGQAPAVATATATIQPSAGVLQDGTPVKLRLLNQLDSHTAKNGDEILFAVVNDVVVGGVTVLRRGSPATGVVTQAAASKTMGRAGKLSFTINDIHLRNGATAPVRAFNRTSGENHTGEMIGMMVSTPIVAAPFFLLIHGTNTTFPRGTEITAFVNGDLPLDLTSFGAGPSAETQDDELKAALQIRSTPNDAQVQVDNADVGSTPLNITVKVGRHDISIKKAGYVDWIKNLNVSGGTVDVEAVLEALKK